MKIGKYFFTAQIMKPNYCAHGPQVWPWWKLAGFGFCKIGVHAPSSGYRFWIYVRKKAALNFDLYIDRRPK